MVAVIVLMLWLVTVSLWGFDLIMALDPIWYSGLFGGYASPCLPLTIVRPEGGIEAVRSALADSATTAVGVRPAQSPTGLRWQASSGR